MNVLLPRLCTPWLAALLLALTPLTAPAQQVVEVLEIDGRVEQATGPAELLRLDGEAGLTVRALRGFGRLPERFAPLILALRGQEVDLLSADAAALDALIARAEAGALRVEVALLRDLRALLEIRDYYDWQVLAPGARLELDGAARLRGDGRVRVRSEDEPGTEVVLAPAGQVVSGAALWAAASQASAVSAPGEALAPSLGASAAGPAADDLLANQVHALLIDMLENVEEVSIDGAPIWDTSDTGAARVRLPGVRLLDVGPYGSADVHLDIGDVVIELSPPDAHGVRRIDARWPQSMALRDAAGTPVGSYSTNNQRFSLQWLESAATMVGSDIVFEDFRVHFDNPAALGIDAAPAHEGEHGAGLAALQLKELAVVTNFAPDGQGRWAGPLRARLSGLSLLDPLEQMELVLGGMTLDVDYQDLDLDALAKLGAGFEDVLERMFEGAPTGGFALGAFAEQMVAAMGTTEATFALEDLRMGADDGSETMQLGGLNMSGTFQPSPGDEGRRDLSVRTRFSDLVAVDGLQHTRMASLESRFALSGLLPGGFVNLILDIANTFMMSAPMPPEGQGGWLSGIELGFEAQGVSVDAGDPSAAHDGEALQGGVDEMAFGFSLKGLDAELAELGLNYRLGARELAVPGMPPELLPLLFDTRLALSQLPVGALLRTLVEHGPDPMAALMLLVQHASALNVETLRVDLPMGGVIAKGTASPLGGSGPDGMPLLGTRADIEIRNLDALARWLADERGDGAGQPDQELEAMVALLKLVGEERVDGDDIIHRFAVVADSGGVVTVNGKDVAPLLAAAMEGEAVGAGASKDASAGGNDAPRVDDASQTQPGEAAEAEPARPLVIQFDPIEGRLDAVQREATHKVVLQQHGALRVEASSNEALKFRLDLYDVTGQQYLRGDANGHQSKRTVERPDLAPGTYHVRLQRQAGEGDYSVRLKLTKPGVANDVEANDAVEQAQAIEVGEPATGLLGYWDAGRVESDDWFRLVIDRHGSLTVDAVSDEALKFRLDLYDVTGQQYLRGDANGRQSKRTVERPDLAPGTYHARVQRQAGQGGYQLIARLAEPDVANDAEPNDAVEQAQAIEVGAPATGLLGYWDAGAVDSVDWFRLETKGHGTLTLNAASDETLKFRLDLYDVTGHQYLRGDANGRQSKRTVERPDLAPGTYHARVQRQAGQGGYQLIARLAEPDVANDAEPNDAVEQAQAIALGTPAAGLLGYWDAGAVDSVDWFRLETEDQGTLTLKAASDETLKFRLDLYDAAGRQHLRGDANGHQSKRTVERHDLAPGTYRVRVQRQAGQGGYSVESALTQAQ